MTVEQYDRCKEFDLVLRMAVIDKVAKSMDRFTLTKINNLYMEITSDNYYQTRLNCSYCVLQLLIQLGKLYQEYIPYETEVTEIVEKRKAGRPKKV